MATSRALRIGKWLIWIGIVAVIWMLRDLFPALFLTFILAYIGNTVIRWLGRWIPNRRISLILVYIVLIVSIGGLTLLIVPRIFDEARQMARLYVAQDAIEGEIVLPEETEPATRTATAPTLRPEAAEPAAAPAAELTVLERETRRYLDGLLIQLVGPESFRSFQQSETYRVLAERVQQWVRGFIPRVVNGVKQFVNGSIAVALQFLLSIVFSFLILWDLPHLVRATTSLSSGRTSEIYVEIAPGMVAFGHMLGRAFEAQSVIALVNSLLTSISFVILGIPSIALLATIVFFCSYIPVFGVFLSTLPAALLAFQVGGPPLVGWLLVAILIVHAVEAYALNPMIYGRHLKLHPVAVLIVLLVAEHLFGVWGLLLSVPITAFVYKYVVRGEPVLGRPASPRTDEKSGPSRVRS
ncbi:MAG: AI-2E family transporter [Thermoanaerobaculia bacterium]